MYTDDENPNIRRASAARSRFVGYILFLSFSIAIVIIGYSSDVMNPLIFMATGLLSLSLAYLLLKSYVRFSAWKTGDPLCNSRFHRSTIDRQNFTSSSVKSEIAR